MHRVGFIARGAVSRSNTLPWVADKRPLTTTYAWFLAAWAKRLSWKEVAEAFHMSWDAVFGAVEMAVAWGRAHVDLSGIQSLGIDEMAWGRGHRYLTLVYQIDADCKRLLWIGQQRRIKTLLRFFRWFGGERSAALRFVCSDMWKPYVKVIAKKASVLKVYAEQVKAEQPKLSADLLALLAEIKGSE